MDKSDLLTLMGLLLLSFGLYWVYPPLAAIAPGVMLIAIGLFGAWQKGGSS